MNPYIFGAQSLGEVRMLEHNADILCNSIWVERRTKKSPENWTVDCWTPEYSNPGRLDDSLVIVVKTEGGDDNLAN